MISVHVGDRVRFVKPDRYLPPDGGRFYPSDGTLGTVIDAAMYKIRWDVAPPAGKELEGFLPEPKTREWYCNPEFLRLIKLGD